MATSTIKSRGITRKTYTIELATNEYVSPFQTHGEMSISSDISSYGQPIGVVAYARSVNPLSVRLSGSSLFVAGSLAETVNIVVTFLGG